MKKVCTKCKKEKDLSLFYKDQSTNDKHTRRCMECLTEERQNRREYNLNYSRYNRSNNKEIINYNKRKSWENLDPRKRMLQQARNRAKIYNFDFNIEIDDIILPDKCPLLNVEFKPGKKGNYSYSYSLDRIDNNKGYIKGNV